MQRITASVVSLPVVKFIAGKTQVAPEYVALVLGAVSLFVIQRTPLGSLFSNLVSCLIVIRDVLLVLRSPSPKIAELRKLVIVLSLFALLILSENIGVNSIIPLFALVKVGLVIWAASNERNANTVYELVFSRIPLEYVQAGDDIDAAVKKAAEAVEDHVEIKNK